MNRITLALFIYLSITSFKISAVESISIIADSSTISNKISKAAVDDCLHLLVEAFQCAVSVNNPRADFLLILPKIETLKSKPNSSKDPFYILPYPEHAFKWCSQRKKNQIHLKLLANCHEVVSFGLYGLLQKHLCFASYRPRERTIPRLNHWPLTEDFERNTKYITSVL